jgi:hypothetical protein
MERHFSACEQKSRFGWADHRYIEAGIGYNFQGVIDTIRFIAAMVHYRSVPFDHLVDRGWFGAWPNHFKIRHGFMVPHRQVDTLQRIINHVAFGISLQRQKAERDVRVSRRQADMMEMQQSRKVCRQDQMKTPADPDTGAS